MQRPKKTYPYIRWADGTLSAVTKRGRMYYFHVPPRPGSNGGEHGTDSMWGVKDAAKHYGGTVERRPNPGYEEQMQTYRRIQLRKNLFPF